MKIFILYMTTKIPNFYFLFIAFFFGLKGNFNGKQRSQSVTDFMDFEHYISDDSAAGNQGEKYIMMSFSGEHMLIKQ